MVLYLFIFRILDLLNTILVICRCSVLCLIIKDKRYGLAYAIEELQIEHFALAGYACYSFVKEMNVSWYMLIMALIAFILIYVLSKINVTKIWIIKNLIYEKIGIQ
mgnify:CR=1 FL=1